MPAIKRKRKIFKNSGTEFPETLTKKKSKESSDNKQAIKDRNKPTKQTKGSESKGGPLENAAGPRVPIGMPFAY